MKNEMLKSYTYGKIDDTKLLLLEHSYSEDGLLSSEIIEYANQLIGFTYTNVDFEENKTEFKFKFSDKFGN